MSRIMISAAIGLIVCSGFSGHAADLSKPGQIAVHYGDLNLDRAAGSDALMRRVRSASAAVCGLEPDIRALGEHARYDACVKKTVSRAMTAIYAHRAPNKDERDQWHNVAER